jgi:hypothetical protein
MPEEVEDRFNVKLVLSKTKKYKNKFLISIHCKTIPIFENPIRVCKYVTIRDLLRVAFGRFARSQKLYIECNTY